MYRFLVRPRWLLFHAVVVGALVAMVNLGLWQLRRLDERRDFNRVVTERTDADIVSLSDLPDVSPAELQWRRVEVQGVYAGGGQVLVVNRSQGGEAGRNVVDVLLLDDGRALLVNRGFVPGLSEVPSPPDGRVTLVGRVKASEQRRTGQAADVATPGQALTEVRRIDLDVLAPQVDRPLAPVYLELLTSDPAEPSPPYPVPSPSLDEGPHLSYAIQWFVFSLAVVVGWALAVRHSSRSRSGAVPSRTPEPQNP